MNDPRTMDIDELSAERNRLARSVRNFYEASRHANSCGPAAWLEKSERELAVVDAELRRRREIRAAEGGE